MSESAREFMDKCEDEIPLLPEERGSLFSDEEMESAKRRRFFGIAAKTLLVSLLLAVVVLSVSAVSDTISYLKQGNLNPQIGNAIIGQFRDSGLRISLQVGFEFPSMVWSTTVRNVQVDVKDTKSGGSLARIVLPNITIRSGKNSIGLDEEPVKIVDPILMAKTLNQVSRTKRLDLSVAGNADVHPHWTLINLRNRQVQKDFSLDLTHLISGKSDLKLSQMLKLENLEFHEDGDVLTINAMAVLSNPLDFVIKRIPTLKLDLAETSNIVLGQVMTLSPIQLKSKADNRFPVRLVLDSSDPQALNAINRLASNIVSGKPTSVVLKGRPDSTSPSEVLWLRTFLSALSLNLDIPKDVLGTHLQVRGGNEPMSLSLVTKVLLKRDRFSILPNAYLTMNNPLPASITIHNVYDMRVTAKKSDATIQLAYMPGPQLDNPIVIPANANDWVNPEPFPINLKGSSWSHTLEVIRMLIKGPNPVDENGRRYILTTAEGIVDIEVEGLPAFKVRFSKSDLPLYYESALRVFEN